MGAPGIAFNVICGNWRGNSASQRLPSMKETMGNSNRSLVWKEKGGFAVILTPRKESEATT